MMRRNAGEKDMPAAKSTPAIKQDEEDAKPGDGPDMRPKVQADADAPIKEQPEIDPATQESDDVGSEPLAIDEANEDGEGRDVSKEDAGEDKAYGENTEMVGDLGDGAKAMASPASTADPDCEGEVQVTPNAETGGFEDMIGMTEQGDGSQPDEAMTPLTGDEPSNVEIASSTGLRDAVQS